MVVLYVCFGYSFLKGLIYVYLLVHMCAGGLRGQKRGLDNLELGLQTVGNCHVGNLNLDPLKSS